MHKRRNIIALGALLMAFPAIAPGIDYFDSYRYALEINADPLLCRHMQGLYSREFRQPWDFRRLSKINALSKFEYVVPDARLEHDLFFSRYPSSPEFDQIQWKEGLGFFDSDPTNQRPILVANFDIDNDGNDDLVIKHGFMLAVCGGGGSCPGGEDHIAVLRPGAVDLGRPVDRGFVIKQYLGEFPRGSSLSYDTLRYKKGEAPRGSEAGDRMSARVIRPFIYKSKTYISVYDAWSVDDPKNRREWMWILDYKGGGSNPLIGDWQPAETITVCRFRMMSASTKK